MEPTKYILRRDLPGQREPNYRIDYRGELNAAQYDAATAGEGPILVIAGAGTGKTRTLVFRVARLVETGVDPARILLLTFTRKASAEMLRRAAALLDGRCQHVAGGTFHSFANTTLRRYGSAVGLRSSFSILDRSDAEDVVHLLRARAGLDAKDKRFPRKQTILEMFSMSVNRSIPLPVLIESEYGHLADHFDDLLRLHAAYEEYKSAGQLADYDDLLVKLWQLLRESKEVRNLLADRFRYILVDEYQDTNAVQSDIVRLLANEQSNVMAVGDDAQSIYSFRGANFRNIMDFPRLFPGTRVIALEENYRSTQPILDLSNAIIARAAERHEKNLFTREQQGPPPILIPAENEHFQSRFICQRILELREEGIPLHEIAVLIRSSFHSFGLEIELAHHDIPFVKRGGFKFIETAHIKDVLAHIRILVNPRDEVSWHRVLTLIDGIGPRTSEEIIASLRDSDDAEGVLRTFPRRTGRGDLETLAGLLARSRPLLTSPEALLGEVLVYYEPLLKRIHSEDHPKRRRDLEQFVGIAARYRDAEVLLSDMALEPPADTVGDRFTADPEDELLVLSTIHSAKGLEWHTVFVPWVCEGRFPSRWVETDEEMEEERRLMYVAATRAKRNLYLSYPVYGFERDVGQVIHRTSRFIEGLPETVLQPLLLVDEPLPEF